jgi:hypothetical protein
MTPLDGSNVAPETATLSLQSARAEATIVDLSKTPNNSGPASDAILVRLGEAMAASQNVILLLGEAHENISHVRFAEEFLQCLAKDNALSAYFGAPVIAIEQPYNLLQIVAAELFPEIEGRFNAAAYHGLRRSNPAAYHRLNALCYAAWEWPQAPVTRLENMNAWLTPGRDSGRDVRMIDMAMTFEGYLDLEDPATTAWIAALALEIKEEIQAEIEAKGKIHGASRLGTYLRNLWMMDQIRAIAQESPESKLTLVLTGLGHVAGLEDKKPEDVRPYEQSLIAVFARDQIKYPNTALLSVLQEGHGLTVKGRVPTAGQAALNTPNTFILTGGYEEIHNQNSRLYGGSFDKEIATLGLRARAQGAPAPCIKTKADYHALREAFLRVRRTEMLKPELGLFQPAARAPEFSLG